MRFLVLRALRAVRVLRVRARREVNEIPGRTLMRGGAWVVGIGARQGEGPSTLGYRGALALDSPRRLA
jgi:hypothetical protein